jgi:NAD(P)-dependent dehydrogenase (short-subunit alcohol dehydrogenase family)
MVDKQVSADIKSIVYCSQESTLYMGEGSDIVNIPPLAGIKPLPSLSVYSTMKATVIQPTRSTAVELTAKSVRVFDVGFGFHGGLCCLTLYPHECPWGLKVTLLHKIISTYVNPA